MRHLPIPSIIFRKLKEASTRQKQKQFPSFLSPNTYSYMSLSQCSAGLMHFIYVNTRTLMSCWFQHLNGPNIHNSWINQFKQNGLSNPYQKDQHISKFRGGGIFRFSSHFNRTFCAANSGDPDQMQVWHLIWVCPVCLRRPTKGH